MKAKKPSTKAASRTMTIHVGRNMFRGGGDGVTISLRPLKFTLSKYDCAPIASAEPTVWDNAVEVCEPYAKKLFGKMLPKPGTQKKFTITIEEA